jgi:hypothetical protein
MCYISRQYCNDSTCTYANSCISHITLSYLLSSKIVLNGLSLGTSGNNVVIKLAPLPVTFGIDKYHIVAPMVVPRMNQHLQ